MISLAPTRLTRPHKLASCLTEKSDNGSHVAHFSSTASTAAASSSESEPSSSSSSSTSFGFETVAEDEKVKKVFEVFQNVSPKYDAMNDAMSLGVHRLWKDAFVRNLGPTTGSKIVDVAGGTGDIAFRILDSLLTAEDKQALEKSFEPVDPSVIVQKGIKDAMDLMDNANGGSSKADEPATSSISRSTGLSASSTNNNNEDENDDLIDPLLQTESRFAEGLEGVNPRTAASMEAIRQKIERLSSSGFRPTDFSEFDVVEELEEEGGNAVEKGGLFVAGNIAGAKAQQVSLSNFSDQRLARVFQKDPNFVTSQEHDEDDLDDDLEVVPLAAPDFIGSTPSSSARLEFLDQSETEKMEDDNDDDNLKLSVVTEFLDEGQPHQFDTEEIVEDDVVMYQKNLNKSANSSSFSDDSSSSLGEGNSSFSDPLTWRREPKSIDKIFEGDPNVHSDTFGVADLEGLGSGSGGGDDVGFDHRQLQVAPSYVDDTISESSPELPEFMSSIESGLGDFGMISDEGMSHDEELNLEHELFENVLPSGGHVTVLDLSPKMIQEGKSKAASLGYNLGISWKEGDAEKLPFPEDTFDAYTIAFGIRNCTHLDKVLAEAYRVLKPGGRFLCLEFSKVSNPVLRQLYDTYSFQMIPVMGQVIAGDWNSYQYLVESIRTFPDQASFKDMIEDAGFRMVQYENLSLGIAAIHSGFKV